MALVCVYFVSFFQDKESRRQTITKKNKNKPTQILITPPHTSLY